MSIYLIGGKIYSDHPKNMNNVNKDSNKLVYVIITLIDNICGGDTMFYDGVKMRDLGNRYHILKHLYGRMILGSFENFITKVLFGDDIEH